MQTNTPNRSGGVFATRNLTLSSLSRPVLDKLIPHLVPLDLPQGFLFVKTEREIAWIYFLDRGMASVTSLDLAGTPLEVGIIGREGIVGIQSLLGQTRTQTTTIMQGAGGGYRVRAEWLREHMLTNPELTRAMHRFLYTLLEQTAQLVLCNRLHSLEARLARWILMAADRMEVTSLRLTQEYLAEMLGVGRPAVTLAAGVLQKSNLITYSRGQINILNRPALRKLTCECYEIIRDASAAVYPTLFADSVV